MIYVVLGVFIVIMLSMLVISFKYYYDTREYHKYNMKILDYEYKIKQLELNLNKQRNYKTNEIMESKLTKLQNDLQKRINDFCDNELLKKEYLVLELDGGSIRSSLVVRHLRPKIKVKLGIED